jgi:reactive intermediate/imine deaminase
MPDLELISTPDTPTTGGPYSPGIVSGGFLFLAGQGPFDAAGNLVGENFAEQLRQTVHNLETLAQAAGTSLANAVRIGVYLNDMGDWAELNELSTEFLTKPYPARTTIQADLNGFLIEVDAIVAIPAAS